MSTKQTAQIIEFPRRITPRTEVPVADYDAWYHAAEISKDQAGRK